MNVLLAKAKGNRNNDNIHMDATELEAGSWRNEAEGRGGMSLQKRIDTLLPTNTITSTYIPYLSIYGKMERGKSVSLVWKKQKLSSVA